MAKPKFSLEPKPTFEASVLIPIPGARPESVKFTFKHRDRTAYREWFDSLAEGGREDEDVVFEIASGWELEDPFDRESVGKLIANYIGSARAIIETYIRELSSAKLGN